MLKSELGAAHSRAGLGPSPASSRYLGGHNQLAPPHEGCEKVIGVALLATSHPVHCREPA